MKHTGPGLDVLVELELELKELVVVIELVVLAIALVVADVPEIFTATGVLWISGPFVAVTLRV